MLCMAAAPLVYARLRAKQVFGTLGDLCPFRNLTGLPCPFCYGVRSWIEIMSGHFGHAFIINPMTSFLLLLDVGAVIWLAGALIFRFNPLPIVEW